MYSEAFCKVYNEFGWNYFPEAFGEQLLIWIERCGLKVEKSLDLGCGTGVLCEILHAHGIKARGMDFSQGMIDIARQRCGDIEYEVADMVTFRPQEKFDLVTCTGDALNHILDIKNVEKIFRNVYSYLEEGGYFIFDILSEEEVPDSEPIDLPFSDEVRAQFRISRDDVGHINLTTTVEEKGKPAFQEKITETIHDADTICLLLEKTGFKSITRSHQLLSGVHADSSTWYITAEK